MIAWQSVERTASVATESTQRLGGSLGQHETGGGSLDGRLAATRPAADRTASVATESTRRLDG